jgi:hypothetical protein
MQLRPLLRLRQRSPDGCVPRWARLSEADGQRRAIPLRALGLPRALAAARLDRPPRCPDPRVQLPTHDTHAPLKPAHQTETRAATTSRSARMLAGGSGLRGGCAWSPGAWRAAALPLLPRLDPLFALHSCNPRPPGVMQSARCVVSLPPKARACRASGATLAPPQSALQPTPHAAPTPTRPPSRRQNSNWETSCVKCGGGRRRSLLGLAAAAANGSVNTKCSRESDYLEVGFEGGSSAPPPPVTHMPRGRPRPLPGLPAGLPQWPPLTRGRLVTHLPPSSWR